MDILPFAHPLYVMLKPAGASCNLKCHYCYYLEKKQLYTHETRHLLSDELLEEFTRQYIQAQTTHEVMFTWHGGETMLRPISFYRRALDLQRKYAAGHHIENCIQTNGTLITEEWARFLHENNWLVGISIDGPQDLHDEFRRTRQDGPTWAKVRRGIDLLNRFDVDWNAMAVVNDYNADYPLDFYRFFRDELQCRYLQFAPIVEQGLDCNVSPQQWGNFLCIIFDEWIRHDVGTMFVQMFDATLAGWMGITPSICTLAERCGHAGVMEFNGDIYSCDHFVSPAYKLGNIKEKTLVEMMYSERQAQFGRMKSEGLCQQCKDCEWLFACHGECPKNRWKGGLNYLCKGYSHYFQHVAPSMDRMKWLLQNELPPAQIMKEPQYWPKNIRKQNKTKNNV